MQTATPPAPPTTTPPATPTTSNPERTQTMTTHEWNNQCAVCRRGRGNPSAASALPPEPATRPAADLGDGTDDPGDHHAKGEENWCVGEAA